MTKFINLFYHIFLPGNVARYLRPRKTRCLPKWRDRSGKKNTLRTPSLHHNVFLLGATQCCEILRFCELLPRLNENYLRYPTMFLMFWFALKLRIRRKVVYVSDYPNPLILNRVNDEVAKFDNSGATGPCDCFPDTVRPALVRSGLREEGTS